jgi:hypothetical protein
MSVSQVLLSDVKLYAQLKKVIKAFSYPGLQIHSKNFGKSSCLGIKCSCHGVKLHSIDQGQKIASLPIHAHKKQQVCKRIVRDNIC